jgi:non-ribosomal peptide synthetase component F
VSAPTNNDKTPSWGDPPSPQYNTDLFEKAHVARLADHLTAFYAAASRSPQNRISELPLMSANERRLIVEEWNTTTMTMPNGKL